MIYVESVPPVRPSAAAEKPGLAPDVLRGVNEQLALAGRQQGCVYLDLWEALAACEGNLKGDACSAGWHPPSLRATATARLGLTCATTPSAAPTIPGRWAACTALSKTGEK